MLGIALGIATLGLGGPGKSIQHQDSSSKQQRSSQKNKDLQNVPVRSAREYVVQRAGGLDVVGYGDGGIPPHIYGQHYVRRGTHKRTNKR